MPSPDSTTAQLEQLANQLDRSHYTTIVTGGCAPTLRVINRHIPAIIEDIHTGDGWFRGDSAGPIAPCGNISAAARTVSRILGGLVG